MDSLRRGLMRCSGGQLSKGVSFGLNYKDKPRIVEPHDYGVHKGSVKLFGYQVGGLSSEPLPNWRWALVNSISDLDLLKGTFPGRRPTASGKHHQWDHIFIRVGSAEKD